jgi:hypothetical protein
MLCLFKCNQNINEICIVFVVCLLFSNSVCLNVPSFFLLGSLFLCYFKN